MKRRGVRAVSVGLVAAAAVAGGCGQRGPLSLPESAQPIQRVEPQAPSAETGPAAAPGEAAEEQKRENER